MLFGTPSTHFHSKLKIDIFHSNKFKSLFLKKRFSYFRSPHKRMLFAAPRLYIHINISLISAYLIRHSRTDVDAAFKRGKQVQTTRHTAAYMSDLETDVSTIAMIFRSHNRIMNCNFTKFWYIIHINYTFTENISCAR